MSLEHYQPRQYDTLPRWTSYWYQLRSVLETGARSVLEVGVGSRVVSSYLRNLGIDVTTFDFDPSLKPDIVGDVRQLAERVGEARYDAVVAFQVLEHLPFSDFAPSLAQMASVSRDVVIISLPYNGYFFQWQVRVWRISWSIGRKFSRHPRFEFNGEHYWEIGTRGHSLARVRREIGSVLRLRREYYCKEYPYHYFFECARRESK